MSGSGAVAGFLPSTNGFHFANSWPHQPDITVPFPTGAIKIGDAANGLCGGMTYAVRDFFEASRPIPVGSVNPPLNSALYAFIVRRLFDSFDIPAGVMQYLSWQAPTRNQFKDTVQDEWPKIKAGVDAGHLVPLGLIRTRSFCPASSERTTRSSRSGTTRTRRSTWQSTCTTPTTRMTMTSGSPSVQAIPPGTPTSAMSSAEAPRVAMTRSSRSAAS